MPSSKLSNGMCTTAHDGNANIQDAAVLPASADGYRLNLNSHMILYFVWKARCAIAQALPFFEDSNVLHILRRSCRSQSRPVLTVFAFLLFVLRFVLFHLIQ